MVGAELFKVYPSLFSLLPQSIDSVAAGARPRGGPKRGRRSRAFHSDRPHRPTRPPQRDVQDRSSVSAPLGGSRKTPGTRQALAAPPDGHFGHRETFWPSGSNTGHQTQNPFAHGCNPLDSWSRSDQHQTPNGNSTPVVPHKSRLAFGQALVPPCRSRRFVDGVATSMHDRHATSWGGCPGPVPSEVNCLEVSCSGRQP